MPVSGSKNFSITRSDIIEASLRKLGVYDQGEGVGTTTTTTSHTRPGST